MTKWLLFIFILLGCVLLFGNPGCHSYFPYLYGGNDSTLMSSFVLVNSSRCSTDQLNAVLSDIASQRPAFILTVGSRSDYAFEFSETLQASVVTCDKGVTFFRTDIFKKRFSDLGLDTTSIPEHAYINFFEGAYNKMLTVSCHNYKDVNDYTNRVVVVGQMGSSYMTPVHDGENSRLSVPYAYYGEKFIYKAQLLAIILNSLVTKAFIVDMPLYLELVILFSAVLVLFIFADFVMKKRWRLIWKVIAFKVVEAIVLVVLFVSLFFTSVRMNYVCDWDLFLRSALIGGEVTFWILYLFYRSGDSAHLVAPSSEH